MFLSNGPMASWASYGCNVAVSLLRLEQRHDKLQTQFCNSFCEIVRVNFRERVISAKYITKKWNDVFIKRPNGFLSKLRM